MKNLNIFKKICTDKLIFFDKNNSMIDFKDIIWCESDVWIRPIKARFMLDYSTNKNHIGIAMYFISNVNKSISSVYFNVNLARNIVKIKKEHLTLDKSEYCNIKSVAANISWDFLEDCIEYENNVIRFKFAIKND